MGGEASARKQDERNPQRAGSRVKQRSAAELLGAGIQALAHADAPRLRDIAEAARTAKPPATLDEQRITQGRLRTLGILMGITERNLRLLRGTAGYGLLGDNVR